MALGSTNVGILFKGAGPGTHWHKTDARLAGFTVSARAHSVNALATHIGAYSHPSAYLSVSTSFAAARQYALSGPAGMASSGSPGHVYEIDLSVLVASPALLNPVLEVAVGAVGPMAHAHNGGPKLVEEIAAGVNPPSSVVNRHDVY